LVAAYAFSFATEALSQLSVARKAVIVFSSIASSRKPLSCITAMAWRTADLSSNVSLFADAINDR
jgi:hypothetical protein